MEIFTCKCGEETPYAEENTNCKNCGSVGLFKQTKMTCRQCHGDKVFYYHGDKDYCTLCDDNGMVST